MDRLFMTNYYKMTYENPEKAAIALDDEYADRDWHFRLLEKRLEELCGGHNTELWKLYEDCMMARINAEQLLYRDLYLMGAQDREKMLE